jgi:protein FAM32A
MTKSSFMGGSLSFKGDKKKSKKNRKPKHKIDDAKKTEKVVDSDEEDMTEAEKGAVKFKMERQRQDSEAIAKKSHRERVEELNERLGTLTEHNDIPRVSAAGNG